MGHQSNTGGAPPGQFDLYFDDISLTSPDGTVLPVYSRTPGVYIEGGIADHPECVSNFNVVDETIAAPLSPKETTTYYHGDQIGSARLLTAGGGWAVWSGTYTPYGQEINPAQLNPPNYYKFTGKERDEEDGSYLDYFGARYYSSMTGRFMSPDWSSNPDTVPYADFTNPQSLNLYSYVMNNPLTNADRDGHDCSDNDATGSFSTDENGDTKVTVNGGCNPPDLPTLTSISNTQNQAAQTQSPSQVMNYASSNPGITTCAADFADKYSIAGGLHSLGIGDSGVSGFITNALGGNIFSGATNLISSFGSGSAGGHSVFYNMGQSLMAGPLQGIPGGRGPWGASVSDLATGAIAGGAFSAVTGAGQTLQGLNGAANLASTGIDAAEFASGVGLVKFGYDAFLRSGSARLQNRGDPMIRESGLLSDAMWVLLVPPVMTALWYLLARTWTGLLGTTNRPRVKGWKRSGIWIILGALYVIGIGFFVYAQFIKS